MEMPIKSGTLSAEQKNKAMFKNILTTLLVLAALTFSGVTFYRHFQSPCDQTLEYSIGRFDDQFSISREQFLVDLLRAERVWEDAAGKNLFSYKEDAKFKINLIYDERQLTTMQKQKTESGLESVEIILNKLDQEFKQMKISFESESLAHDARSEAFKLAQKEYESMVDFWNSKGGAPRSQYEELQKMSEELQTEAANLNANVSRLNAKARELNALLDRRNEAARNYNKVASGYNQSYGHGLEFNQAEYVGGAINVYQFTNSSDLLTALAHEFGHALGMDHVENSSSVMYYLTGDNTETGLVPTVEDLEELRRVCGL